MTTYSTAEKFVADTHALIWHLSGSPQLSTEARRRFAMADRGEAIIYLSVMSCIEMLYLYEKGKIARPLWELFNHAIRAEPDGSYQVIDVTHELAVVLAEVPREVIPELPDRLIAATAYQLGLPLISKDERIQRWEGIVSIW